MLEKEKKAFLSKNGYLQMHVKAFLFDMDGVLVDSMPNHTIAWCQMAEENGLQMSREEVYLNEGRTGASTINELVRRTWNRNATEEETERMYRRKSQIFNSLGMAKPMSGALRLLQQINQIGLEIILVTGSGQKTLLNILKQYYDGIFSPKNMVTAFDVKCGKPSPEPYLIALQKAGVKANEAIVVENAPLGIRSGVAAGIFTIAVNTGLLSDEILFQEGANVIFPSMDYFADNWNQIYTSLK